MYLLLPVSASEQIQNPYEVVIIQDNTLQAVSPPTNYHYLSLGSGFDGQTDMEYLISKYPAMAEGLIKLGKCESGLNLQAKGDNKTSLGLFQFKQTTWQENCEGDIWSAENQINCAVKLIKKGEGERRWTNCWIKENLDLYF